MIIIDRSILLRLANTAARRAYEQTQVKGSNFIAEKLCAVAAGYVNAAKEGSNG